MCLILMQRQCTLKNNLNAPTQKSLYEHKEKFSMLGQKAV